MQVYVWEGAVYEGQVADGKRQGYGTMQFSGSSQVYEGLWRDGQRHGRGTLYFNGERSAYYDGMHHCIRTCNHQLVYHLLIDTFGSLHSRDVLCSISIPMPGLGALT